MRLIDADVLINKAWDVLMDKAWDTKNGFVWEKIVSIKDVADAPTIDAVEVVRCRDCEYWKYNSFVLDHDYCELTSTECEGDHFCSWGEKKNE